MLEQLVHRVTTPVKACFYHWIL